MPFVFIRKNQVEEIVHGDLKEKYRNMKAFEFRVVELREFLKEWWATGVLKTENDLFRGFFYRLNAETGEIVEYKIVA